MKRYTIATPARRCRGIPILLLAIAAPIPMLAQPSALERGSFKAIPFAAGQGALVFSASASFAPQDRLSGRKPEVFLSPQAEVALGGGWSVGLSLPLWLDMAAGSGLPPADGAAGDVTPEASAAMTLQGRLCTKAGWHSMSGGRLLSGEARLSLPLPGLHMSGGNAALPFADSPRREHVGLSVAMYRMMDPVALGLALSAGLTFPEAAGSGGNSDATAMALRLALNLTEALNSRISIGAGLAPGVELAGAGTGEPRLRFSIGAAVRVLILSETSAFWVGLEERFGDDAGPAEIQGSFSRALQLR